MNATLVALGLPRQDPAVVLGHVGHGARTLVERTLGPEHRDRVEEGLAAFLAWYGAHLLDRSRPYPGLPEALDGLAAVGAICSVLTNKPASLSDAIVDGLGLRPRLPRLVGGDTYPTRKPDPSGLLALVAATGVPASATLMIGDSAVDVATGRNAGVATCAVLWGFVGTAIRDAGADCVAVSPADLIVIARGGIAAARTTWRGRRA